MPIRHHLVLCALLCLLDLIYSSLCLCSNHTGLAVFQGKYICAWDFYILVPEVQRD